MIWKLKSSPVFWLPVPYLDQHLMNLTEWTRDSTIQPEIIELTDPDTNEAYKVEILNYLGPYPMDAIPSFIARDIGGKLVTGNILAQLLRKRKPEFKTVQKVIFYQVNPIKPDDSQKD